MIHHYPAYQGFRQILAMERVLNFDPSLSSIPGIINRTVLNRDDGYEKYFVILDEI